MCKQCQVNPVYQFTNKRKLCRNCFIRYFQKKVLYTIRKFKMAKKGDVIMYENKGDFRSVVLKDVLKFFSEKANVKLTTRKGKNVKVAIVSSLDLESYEIIDKMINKEMKEEDFKEISPVKGRIIKPLYLFLDEEILLYARLKKLKFNKVKEKKNKVSLFIDELERKHPEIKRAIVNSFLN